MALDADAAWDADVTAIESTYDTADLVRRTAEAGAQQTHADALATLRQGLVSGTGAAYAAWIAAEGTARNTLAGDLRDERVDLADAVEEEKVTVTKFGEIR